MASDEVRKVTLKCSDGEEFVVEESVAMESQMIRNIIEDGFANDKILLPNVNSKILSKVIEYCKKHVESAAKPSVDAGSDENSTEEHLKGWDSDFVKVDQATLSDLTLAAKYLDIKGLLNLTSQTAAIMIKKENSGNIHKHLNIKEDFTIDHKKEWQLQEESLTRRAFKRRENLTRRAFKRRRQMENQWDFDVEAQSENQWEFDVEAQSENHAAFGEKLSLRERITDIVKFLCFSLMVLAVLTFWASMSMQLRVN